MSELPHGIVVFLFTDIEGSTAQWERDRAAMRAAVERHLDILRQAIESHNGVVFKTVGDAVQAVFATAADGLAAAVAAQQALTAEAWPDPPGPLRVRIALHAGTAAPVGGDYLAPSLNRLSRLLLVSHGGQIVLTETVRRLLDEMLPPATVLRDLGEHRLRDLLEPERVWQVEAPGIPADFPPLRAVAARPNNLPTPPTPIIGRETEVATVLRHFREGARLITLTGPGGTGKTRLALEAAAELLEDFADGIWFLDLAGLTDPALLLPQVATLLGLRESGERPVADRLAQALAGKRVLLVFDNLEQFRPYEELGRVVAGLVTATPSLAILATSRSPLRLRVERELPLAPLAVPMSRQTSIEALAESPAVMLFVTRAQAVRPGFTLGPHNAGAIADLCRRLDGLPLAIELAAARVRALTPADIVTRLGSRLDLLADPKADRPDRQRTLEATIAWSYDLLSTAEQAAFRRLAVFAGGFTLDAAEAVLGVFGEPPLDALDAVMALVEQGMLRDEEQADGTLRFRMLETVRAFGLERLREIGEEDAARQAHADYFRALVERAFAEGEPGDDESAWLEQLETELDNVRAALERIAEAGTASELLALAVRCWQFWWPRGYWTEARRWLERALAAATDAPELERARALRALGLIADVTGDQQRGRELLEEGLCVAQQHGDRRGEWQILLDLSLHWASRDYRKAGQYAEQALAVARESSNPVMVAQSLNRLGNWQLNREQPQEAIARHREALQILEELGDTHDVAATLDLLGMATALASDRSGATRWYERAVTLWREIGDRQGLAESLVGSAQWAHSYHSDTLPAFGTLDQVRPLGEESLTICREIGWRAGESFALWAYRGNVLGSAGEYATAVPSTWEALSIARAIGHAQWITGARSILGDLYTDLGDLAAAEEELRGALALAQEIASPYWVRGAAGKLVSALAVGGRLDEAQEVLEEHVEDAPTDTLASRILWCSAADLALASGDPERALSLVDRLVKTVPRIPGTALRAIPRLELLRGRALTVLGRYDEAERALEAGCEAAMWSGARPLLWRILAAQGLLAHERGQMAEARQAAAAAQSLVAELAAGIPDDALRSRFLDRAQETMAWAAPSSAPETTG